MVAEVKGMNEVLRDIIAEAKRFPHGWKSVVGYDHLVHAEDICIFHDEAGIYKLKKYDVNPFRVDGIGAKLGRHIDALPLGAPTAQFEIVQIDMKRLIERVLRHQDPVEALLKARQTDLDVDVLMSGPVEQDQLMSAHISQMFPDDDKLLRKKFRNLTSDNFGHYG
jgi:hypothetical protein